MQHSLRKIRADHVTWYSCGDWWKCAPLQKIDLFTSSKLSPDRGSNFQRTRPKEEVYIPYLGRKGVARAPWPWEWCHFGGFPRRRDSTGCRLVLQIEHTRAFIFMSRDDLTLHFWHQTYKYRSFTPVHQLSKTLPRVLQDKNKTDRHNCRPKLTTEKAKLFNCSCNWSFTKENKTVDKSNSNFTSEVS